MHGLPLYTLVQASILHPYGCLTHGCYSQSGWGLTYILGSNMTDTLNTTEYQNLDDFMVTQGDSLPAIPRRLLENILEKNRTKFVRGRVGVRLPQIQRLDENSTESQLNEARRNSAASWDGKVFLPTTAAGSIPLPNLFLRSALFTAATIQHSEAGRKDDIQEKVRIATHSKASIKLSGYRLNRYDLRVYATCLDMYKNRPLATLKEEDGVQISYSKLASLLGGRTASALIALRESLFRLSRANIDTHLDLVEKVEDAASPQQKVHLRCLVKVEFPDEYTGCSRKSADGKELPPNGRSVLRIRITERTAYLFGMFQWSAVPNEALKMAGFKGWLACYCTSHSKPMGFPLSFFHRISGLEGNTKDFPKQLTEALSVLKNDSLPARMRVPSYTISVNKAVISEGGKFGFKNTTLEMNYASRRREKTEEMTEG